MYSGMTTTIVGGITEPELRWTDNGKAVCSFSLAVAKRIRTESGTWQDSGNPTWVRVTAWGPLAEHVAESLAKGSRAIVTGTIENRQWKTEQGEIRYTLEMTADAVGAELTFATAKISKASRDAAPPSEEWATASRTRPEPAGAQQ
jgi:single-strand DNA-binding protein